MRNIDQVDCLVSYEPEFILKIFGEGKSFFWTTDTPVFGQLLMSPPGFKIRVDSFICALKLFFSIYREQALDTILRYRRLQADIRQYLNWSTCILTSISYLQPELEPHTAASISVHLQDNVFWHIYHIFHMNRSKLWFLMGQGYRVHVRIAGLNFRHCCYWRRCKSSQDVKLQNINHR